MIGEMFGYWTVIAVCDVDSCNNLLVECQCICGKKRIIQYSRLHKKRTGHCGCKTSYRYIDLAGMRSGTLTVMYRTKAVNKNCRWICKCDCGGTAIVCTSKLTKKQAIRCRRCAEIAGGTKNRKTDSGFRKLLRGYKISAAKRCYEWSLTDTEALQLFQSTCAYCDIAPLQISRHTANSIPFMFNGIDRVDNTIGYSKSNCVPCCKWCNHAKSDMSKADFISLVSKIYEKRKNSCNL